MGIIFHLIASIYGVVSWIGHPFSTKLIVMSSVPSNLTFLSKNNFRAVLDQGSIDSVTRKSVMVIGEPASKSSQISVPPLYTAVSPWPAGEEAL